MSWNNKSFIRAKGAAITDASKNPIRIHAQVWKGSNPVIGATVKYL